MKVLIFLMLSSFLLAQPQKMDTVNMPSQIKEATQQIVVNNLEAEKATKQLNQEMEKQLELMKQIKLKIAKLKKAPKAPKIEKIKPPTEINPYITTNATKVEELFIEIDGQIVQWEPIPRGWIGRLLYSNDIIYYPFIVDQFGNKIYIK